MRKKYCIFSAQYFPHLGGVERYTYNLARFLEKRGNEVVIVTSNGQNLPACEWMEGIKVYRVPCWNLLAGRYPFLKPNKEFRKIDRILMRTKFDMVIVNTRFYPHSVYGAYLARRQKAKCIMIEHGTGHMTVHNKIADAAEQVIEHGLTLVDRVLCREYYGVSLACVEWLKHFHITGKGALYNAIDLGSIEKIREQAQRDFREEYRIPEEAVVIAYTGRLLKEKGIYQMIDAVKKIRRKDEKVYLLMAGDGDEEKGVQAKTDKGIIALGRLEFADVIALLDTSDIFCLPSDSEGFSTSLLEAAACGCYIVTTERGGAKELILNDEYGMVMKDNRPETVLQALSSVLSQKNMRERAVEKTYQRLKDNFIWEKTAEKVEQIADR
ncbi:MAG: glycosyltransferase family 4 protein [Lachnospiraceae bacterium]|nr:glycosyltransferase family 4 protein [Lachnospiraceae bacterium]